MVILLKSRLCSIENLWNGRAMEMIMEEGRITELLTAPPAITSSQMGLSHSSSDKEGADASETSIGRAGRVHPNGHASRGDGARGHRVNPPDTFIVCPSAAIFM
jgi:hypothetical protein